MILKLDCQAGISGDMLVCALYDLCERMGLITDQIDKCLSIIESELDHVHSLKINFRHVKKNGFDSTLMDISMEEDLDPAAMSVHNIRANLVKCINAIEFDEPSKARMFALNAFNKLAGAEARVHGLRQDDDDSAKNKHLHLHELASVDTIVDIACTAKCLDLIEFFNTPDTRVYSTPVSVGRGVVKISHGILAVPAPAVLEILKEHSIPYVEGFANAELTTPTGSALLVALNPVFEPIQTPVQIKASGVGAGHRTFPDLANVLRILVLEPALDPGALESTDSILDNLIQETMKSSILDLRREKIARITITVDDVTPEDVGFLIERSYELGGLEVFTTPLTMKKSRTGLEIKVLSTVKVAPSIIKAWLEESTSLGCRVEIVDRVVINRVVEKFPIEIELAGRSFKSHVRVKRIACFKPGSPVPAAGRDGHPCLNRPAFKIEYDDLVRASKALGISLFQAKTIIEAKVKMMMSGGSRGSRA
ncbi:MAG: LarC family nickel insertion protein [Promethearchaeota archaeon]